MSPTPPRHVIAGYWDRAVLHMGEAQQFLAAAAELGDEDHESLRAELRAVQQKLAAERGRWER